MLSAGRIIRHTTLSHRICLKQFIGYVIAYEAAAPEIAHIRDIFTRPCLPPSAPLLLRTSTATRSAQSLYRHDARQPMPRSRERLEAWA
jgi:hypothetical protein